MKSSSSTTKAFLAVLGLVLAVVAIWWAASSTPGPTPDSSTKPKEYRIAVFSYVTHPVLDQVRVATETTLTELAQKEGNTVQFAQFNAEGSETQISLLSQTILQEAYDLIIPIATPVSRQIIIDAPKDRRIVYSFVTNPENLGAERFDRNVTGISDAVNYPGNIRALAAWMPSAKNFGFLYNPSEPNSVDALNRTKPLIEGMGGTLTVATVSRGDEVSTAAASIAPHIDVFYVGGDNTVVGEVPSLVAVANQYRRPVFASDSGSVGSGAVAAISVDYDEIGHETARVAWQVLHDGKEPRSIPPVSVPGTKALFNPEAAKMYGLTPPVGEFDFKPVTPDAP